VFGVCLRYVGSSGEKSVVWAFLEEHSAKR